MAKVKIQGHASGTGVFTVTAPNSNTDRTITLPDADVTLGTDATKLPLAGGTLTGELTVSQSANSEAIDVATDGTTVNGLRVNASELTTGKAGYFYSNASGSQTRQLVRITNDHASATGTTGLYIDNDSTGLVADFHGAAGIRSANGIKFGSDTAAANALHDYEEGTFTPTIIGGGGGAANNYTSQVGNYTKIGNMVRAQIYLNAEKNNISGQLWVAGLPFATNTEQRGYMYEYYFPSGTAFVNTNAIIYNGESQLKLWANTSANNDGTARTLTVSDVSNIIRLYFNITYSTAS